MGDLGLLPTENLVPCSPDFADRVMARIQRYRRRVAAIRIAILVGAATLLALLVSVIRH